MAYLNKAQLIGNLTAKPELRKTANDKSVANFTVALNNPFGGENTEALFLDVTAWNRTAEIVSEYAGKGSTVFVEGRLELHKWQDNGTGEARRKLIVVADNVQLLDRKPEAPAPAEPAPKKARK